MQFIHTNNEKKAVAALLDHVLTHGQRHDLVHEVLNCGVSIDFNDANWRGFCDFIDTYIEASNGADEFVNKGWAQATKTYTQTRGSITKPSYKKRLDEQCDMLSKKLATQPKLSNASFTILDPKDHSLKRRPGYIPCLTSGQFMIRDGALHMTAYFRSHNAYTHGLADLYYMRRAQIDMVDAIKAKAIKPEIQECGVGSMTLFFNRAFAPHTIRVPKRKKTPSRRVFPHSQQQRFLKHLKSR